MPPRSAWRSLRRAAHARWSEHAALFCGLFAALWFGATIGFRPLAIPDEGRYVGVAWEMLRSGQWAVPTLDGMPFFHKPPLFYWITAASLQVFGDNAAAARMAPWLAAVVTTTGFFVFLKRWAGVARAVAGTVVLATLPLFYAGAQYANLDMLVAAAIASTVLLFAHATLSREQGRPYRQALAFGFASAALGVLSKGLIGLVLPGLVIMGWSLATRRAGKMLALSLWAPGWLIFIAVAAPWFLLMAHRYPDFLHYFFVVQHVERFTGSSFNNLQPFWFYPAVLLLCSLPWSGGLAWRVLRARTIADASTRRDRDLRTLMLVWLAVVTAFFSVSSSKLVGYILPAVPPFAFLLAEAASGLPARWRMHSAIGAAVFCPLLAISAHYWQPKSLEALALHLKANRQPGERVIDLEAYDYDVPFYARLDTPMTVVDRWSADELAKDSWRRELKDAERFADAATPRHLLPADRLPALLCANTGTWLIAAWPLTGGSQWLGSVRPSIQVGARALWHLQRDAPATRAVLACAAPVELAGSISRSP